MEGHGGVKTLDRLGAAPTDGYLLKKIRETTADSSSAMMCLSRIEKRMKKSNAVVGWHGCLGEQLFVRAGIDVRHRDGRSLPRAGSADQDLLRAGTACMEISGRQCRQSGLRDRRLQAGRDSARHITRWCKEVRECLANLDTDFPQLRGLKTEICGFVWFQGWNDMCQPGDDIRQQLYDEYCPNLFIWFRTCEPNSRCRTCPYHDG